MLNNRRGPFIFCLFIPGNPFYYDPPFLDFRNFEKSVNIFRCDFLKAHTTLWRSGEKCFYVKSLLKHPTNLFNCLKFKTKRQLHAMQSWQETKISLTIITSETELIDRIYIVTPTTTGSPEIDNIFKNISVKEKITLRQLLLTKLL